MTAFFVATAKVKDPTKYGDYAKKAGASMKEFGGEIIVRGQVREVLAGGADYNGVGIVPIPKRQIAYRLVRVARLSGDYSA